jgi:hypothetical protein
MAHFRFWNSADVLDFQFWEVRIHFSLDAMTDIGCRSNRIIMTLFVVMHASNFTDVLMFCLAPTDLVLPKGVSRTCLCACSHSLICS